LKRAFQNRNAGNIMRTEHPMTAERHTATKRIAIFAHFDRDGLIDEYVLRYLRGLKPVAQRTLFITDCELKPGEAAKLEGLADLVFSGRHGEYDFGSWKRGYAHLGDTLDDWDEVIVANDSCYAPLSPLEEVFARMDAVQCDFWGASATKTRHWCTFDHLNSFFLVFRRPVLADPEFRAFWPQVTAQTHKKQVVEKYERGLSRLLVKRGHRWGSLVSPRPYLFPLPCDYRQPVPEGFCFPWLRVGLFRANGRRVPNLAARLDEINQWYPRALIDAHMLRVTGTDSPPHYHFRLGSFRWAPGDGRAFHVRAKVRGNRWWKIDLFLFGVPVFALFWPIPKRQ
jgi:lipopolysaccharide biosynthesis protein